MSTGSLEALGVSTEALTATALDPVGDATEASSRNWKGLFSTERASDSPPAVNWEAVSWMQTDTDSLPEDHPSTTLRQVDASPPVTRTNGTFSSTTISRAGERTLLSVTSSSGNSSSAAFTEDSMSHHPPSTSGTSAAASETEDYTLGASKADFTDQNVTRPFEGVVPETGNTGRPTEVQSKNTQPNVTRHEPSSTSEETSDSTAPLGARETSTGQPEPAWTSLPSVTLHTEASTNVSGADQEVSFASPTESSTGIHTSSTQKLEGTEMVSSQTSEQTGGFGLTTVVPAVSNGAPEEHPVTHAPVVTEVVRTSAPATTTERYL